MPVALAYRRHLGWGVTLAALAFGLLWVFLLADRPAHSDPTTFFSTLLDAVTLGALYFIVASGFTLIFGLMRVVNMAHGSLYLVAAYVAIDVQRRIITGNPNTTVDSSQVSIANWFVVLLVAAVVAGLIGLAMQQVLLRWNQGQDLRQALITIALSVIVADQIVVRTGGVAEDMSFPGTVNQFVDLHIRNFSYSGARLFILGLALVIGIALWLWLKRTRTGMVIRAGVDDRAMVSALGVNIQRVFAVAFFVGSALAGIGAVIGTSQTAAATGTDGAWLLNSLVVVIIGGMGSLGGAAVGAMLYGIIGTFSAAYLPQGNTQYAVIFTFVLLAIVLAVRPYGIFGRPA
ncbi:MAG: branched-chain amino acid ABC transporter permease [Actinomycetota bacterium]|nr:branched-chain amino acid ABC transporter permease [Actinomycetota bacterium]